LTVPIEFVPVGRGELGEKAVTREGSAAAAAVLAALTATGPCVPSVISVGHEFATVFAVPWFAVTVPEIVAVPVTVTDPRAFDPAGSGEFGDRATTSEGSAAAAAVLAALTAAVLVPSVMCWNPARPAVSIVGIVLVPSVTRTYQYVAAAPLPAP
jgi:hypothetical protein